MGRYRKVKCVVVSFRSLCYRLSHMLCWVYSVHKWTADRHTKPQQTISKSMYNVPKYWLSMDSVSICKFLIWDTLRLKGLWSPLFSVFLVLSLFRGCRSMCRIVSLVHNHFQLDLNFDRDDCNNDTDLPAFVARFTVCFSLFTVWWWCRDSSLISILRSINLLFFTRGTFKQYQI